MRGANINFVFPFNGYTPLHWAIQEGVSSKIVKFLIKNDAYPHVVDNNGQDCCEKSLLNERYHDVSELVNQYGKYDKSLRKGTKQMYQLILKTKEMQMRENVFGTK